MRLKVNNDELTIEDDGSFVSKLIAGCKGKIKIKTPFGVREIKKVKFAQIETPKEPQKI